MTTRPADGDSIGTVTPHGIVGRAEQLERLQITLDEVVADGSRFVLIGGDAGAGKTTVVQGFVAALGAGLADRRAQVVHGQCVPLGGDGLPFAPIVGTLRELIASHGSEQVLDWAGAGRHGLGALLPDLVQPSVQSDSLRLQLFEAVAMLWERASELGPLIVVLEDIHWADESTRHLLRFLARALTDSPVLVLATYRTDELTRRHPLRPFLAELGRLPGTVRIDIPRMERAEVAELLSRLLKRPPSNTVIDLVHRRSEGIPYFVEELARSAAHGCVDMPDTLRDALNVRIQTLSDSTQETLRQAAVAGNRVDHDLLAAVSSLTADELEANLREAIDASVLTSDDSGYEFRHALLREVIHDDLLPGQHARLHAQFAAALEARPALLSTDTAALEIAHHWSAAHEVTKAFRWSITAATSGSPAHYEALKLYERALELWDRVEDPESVAGPRASVLERASRAANDAGEPERALALVVAALEETAADASLERAARLVLKGGLLATLMRPGAVEALEEAAQLVPADPPSYLRARVLDWWATNLMLGGDRTAAIEVADRAIVAAAAAGSASIESSARNTRGSSLGGLGAEDEGLAELARSGELARGDTRTQLRYYVNASDALHLAGRYEEAVDKALAGIDVARNLGLERSKGAMLAGNAAEPLLAIGEWSRARHMVERALELDPPAHYRAHLRLVLAWIQLWAGELDEADVILTEFRHLVFENGPAPQYTALVARVDGEHALASGDYERAWDLARAFFEHWDVYHAAQIYPVLAVAAAAASNLDRPSGGSARTDEVRRLAARAAPVGVRACWSPMIEAELSDTADGWRVALQQLSRVQAPAHLAPYAGLKLGQHLVAARDRAAAREVLITAADQARELGAGLLIGRIATLSHRAGFAAVATTARELNPINALTPRELEVLQLVAEGRSNGEIGTALFISTKTASVHVSNILAKLGVASRGEASALAHRDGLVATG
ncbi:MAG: AAA family ATPase [Propionibacteriaceae bacterium]